MSEPTPSAPNPPAAPLPHPPEQRGSLVPTTPTDWVLTGLGLALIAYGIWRVADGGGLLFGLGAVALGLIILPYRLAGIVGGLAMVALGVREFVMLQSLTVLGGVLVILGVVSIAERLRRPGRD